MRTPRACRSFTSELPARNQRSSATTDRKASRFVVTAGNPRERSKRIISPNTARVPIPVRSARSSPSSSAFRRMSRYWRTLALETPVHAPAGADPADRARAVTQDLAAHVFHRPLETHEAIVSDKGDGRRSRVAGGGLHVEHVVADRTEEPNAIPAPTELGIRERRA